jgi:hypothetical protein
MYMKRKVLSSNRRSKTEMGKSPAGGPTTQKTLDVEVDPEMCTKTKDRITTGQGRVTSDEQKSPVSDVTKEVTSDK